MADWDTVTFEFAGEDEERVNIMPIGEAILAVDLDKKSFGEIEPVNTRPLFIFVGLEILLAVLSPRFMGFSVHPYYFALAFGLFYVVLNFQRILFNLGFIPSHKVAVECSPIINSDSVTKSVINGTVDEVVDAYKTLTQDYIHEKVKAPFEVINSLFGVNRRVQSEKVQKNVDLEDLEDIDLEKIYSDFMEMEGNNEGQ